MALDWEMGEGDGEEKVVRGYVGDGRFFLTQRYAEEFTEVRRVFLEDRRRI